MGQLNAGIIPVTPFQQNCTVLFDNETKLGIVVDPGGDVDHILSAIKANGFNVEAIWLTHGHLDHAGGAMELKEKLGGIEIIGPHKDDASLLSNIEAQAARFGVPGTMHNCTPDRYLEEGKPFHSASTSSRSCTAQVMHPVTSCSTMKPRNSPMSAMCCSTARSGARTCRVETMRC